MRTRLGMAALVLAVAPFGAGAAPAQATTVAWPAYLNVVVESSGNAQEQPRWRLETAPLRTDDATTSTTPDVTCSTAFAAKQAFVVNCRPKTNPPSIVLPGTGEVVDRSWRCQNAGVRATIEGPVSGESITGRIVCGEPIGFATSCTAHATTPQGLARWGGACAAAAPSGPMPIRCEVDLSNVLVDNWTVTCMTTDP